MRRKRFLLFILLLWITVIILSCKKKRNDHLSGYNISAGSLSIAPLDTVSVMALVPLGGLNPPGHTFPSDHMGFYYKNFGVSRSILSPGNLRIFEISRDRHGIGTPGETQDYHISFGNQNSTVLYFGHVNTLSTRLLDAAGSFTSADCNTYTAGGLTQEQCRKTVSIDATAGEIIGTGGVVAGQFALDMGMLADNNPVCPLDYFDAATRAKLEAKLGSYDGAIKRTQSPVCGEINQDVAGTLQGIWLKQGLPKYPEDNHIAFVKDNVEPNKLRISIGNAVSGLASNVYTFTPQSSGQIDRSFIDVVSNGSIFCYTPRYLSGAAVTNTSLIVKLENTTTLSFEKRNCDCSCNQPYTFTGAKITYVRQ
jgi:hypothetical protein